MFFIARTCSAVRAMTSELVCAGASVVSMGVWLLGESLDPAMVAASSPYRTLKAYLRLSLGVTAS